MKNKGFTLIELLAVIVIIGIIMLIALPEMATRTANNRLEKCNRFVNTLRDAIYAYADLEMDFSDVESKPITLQQLYSDEYILDIPKKIINPETTSYGLYRFKVTKNGDRFIIQKDNFERLSGCDYDLDSGCNCG